MSKTFKEWRESMIILGTENKPKVMLPQWYTQHKKC